MPKTSNSNCPYNICTFLTDYFIEKNERDEKFINGGIISYPPVKLANRFQPFPNQCNKPGIGYLHKIIHEDLSEINAFQVEIDKNKDYLHSLTNEQYVNNIMNYVHANKNTKKIVSKEGFVKRLEEWAEKQPKCLTAKFLPFSVDYKEDSIDKSDYERIENKRLKRIIESEKEYEKGLVRRLIWWSTARCCKDLKFDEITKDLTKKELELANPWGFGHFGKKPEFKTIEDIENKINKFKVDPEFEELTFSGNYPDVMLKYVIVFANSLQLDCAEIIYEYGRRKIGDIIVFKEDFVENLNNLHVTYLPEENQTPNRRQIKTFQPCGNCDRSFWDRSGYETPNEDELSLNGW